MVEKQRQLYRELYYTEHTYVGGDSISNPLPRIPFITVPEHFNFRLVYGISYLYICVYVHRTLIQFS